MNNTIDDDRRSCSSVIDPELNPATAAVENLKFFPEMEFKCVRLLSEKDEDYGHNIHENDDRDFYELQNLGYEDRMSTAFNKFSLSRISEFISKGHVQSIRTNTTIYRTTHPSKSYTGNIKDFFSIIDAARDRDVITKKQRRLVRCIAWDSQLAQLDSSPSVIRERGCSTISHLPPKRL